MVSGGSLCLHCLSAFTAFPTLLIRDGGQFQVGSPLPFGVHRVPDFMLGVIGQTETYGLHCLSAFTAFPTLWVSSNWPKRPRVSIAFRRSPRSRRGRGAERPGERLWSPLPFGVHRVPDPSIKGYLPPLVMSPLPFGVHRVPDTAKAREFIARLNCLHCLSAFTAFPTGSMYGRTQSRVSGSPLPFGVHRVPDRTCGGSAIAAQIRSPLPFGVHRVPDSKNLVLLEYRSASLHCLSAFTAFPTSTTVTWHRPSCG